MTTDVDTSCIIQIGLNIWDVVCHLNFEFYSICISNSLTKITTYLDCLNELGSRSCQYARDLA